MIKNLLNPKWQHPDAAVRRQAIEESRLKDDILLELARSDPDSGVRELAVSHLQDLQHLLTLAESDADANATGIPARVHDLILGADPQSAPDMRTLQRCHELCSDEDLRLSLLIHAPYAALREMAAESVDKDQVLAQSVLNDKSGEVRRAAVQRIADEDILKQIARQLRGSDKTTARLADEKRAQLQQQRETATQRQQLLQDLQAYADGTKPLNESAVDKLVVQWESHADTGDTDGQDRFNALRATLDPMLERHRQLQAQEREARSTREAILQGLADLEQHCPQLDPEESAHRLATEQGRWHELDALQNTGAQERFEHDFDDAVERIHAIIAQQRGLSKIQHQIDTTIKSLEACLEAGAVSRKELNRAHKQRDSLNQSIEDRQAFDKPLQRIHNLVEKLENKLADQQARERTLHAELKAHIEALEAALQEKTLKKALVEHKKAHDLLVNATDIPAASLKSLEQRLHHCEPALRELKSWRNYGTDHVREELINEALALCDAPPANINKLAKQLTDLRTRWKELGPLEPGAKAQWEKFDAACTKAHEPVKTQHDADARARREHLEQRKAICKRLEDLVNTTSWDEQPDWHAIDKAMGEARRQWNKTGGVPHKAWPGIKKRFDRAIKDLDHHLAPERERNFSFRQTLVYKAEQLAQEEDNRAATAAARELRKQWQVSVHSPNRREKQLWQAFNKAMDRIFQKDRDAREQFKASLDENQHKAEGLSAQLEQLAGADDHTVRARREELQQATDQFAALNLPRKNRRQLENRFDKARKTLSQRIDQADDALRHAQLEQLYRLHRLCAQLEANALGQQDGQTSEELQSQWDAAEKPATQKAALHRVEKRFRDALSVAAGERDASALGDLGANADRKRQICIDLEILLHAESPENERNQRMQRQVELMENAMKGMDQDSPDRIRELRLTFLDTGPAEPGLQSEFEERFSKLFAPST